mmetsp:Transcript_46330/g.108733  ORF Transcript_46330/g.108733 Transcript_46330/m.108733 type:complete len:244 (-) Transcript_46330:1659-2390(-)
MVLPPPDKRVIVQKRPFIDARELLDPNQLQQVLETREAGGCLLQESDQVVLVPQNCLAIRGREELDEALPGNGHVITMATTCTTPRFPWPNAGAPEPRVARQQLFAHVPRCAPQLIRVQHLLLPIRAARERKQNRSLHMCGGARVGENVLAQRQERGGERGRMVCPRRLHCRIHQLIHSKFSAVGCEAALGCKLGQRFDELSNVWLGCEVREGLDRADKECELQLILLSQVHGRGGGNELCDA